MEIRPTPAQCCYVCPHKMSNLVPRVSSFFNLAAAGERTGQNTSRENRLGASRKSTSYESKGGFFLGESKNGFVISDHKDSSLPKKRKIRKRIVYHDNGMSSCSSWEKKNKTN